MPPISRDQAPVLCEPGTRLHYSNPGIAMLGYAMTAALKDGPAKDIRSLLRDRVLRPILRNMARIALSRDDGEALWFVGFLGNDINGCEADRAGNNEFNGFTVQPTFVANIRVACSFTDALDLLRQGQLSAVFSRGGGNLVSYKHLRLRTTTPW